MMDNGAWLIEVGLGILGVCVVIAATVLASALLTIARAIRERS